MRKPNYLINPTFKMPLEKRANMRYPRRVSTILNTRSPARRLSPVQDNPEVLFTDQPSHSNGPALSIIPLGGVGEIGLNMTVLEYGDDIIVVDAGLMFPDAEMLGVDIVIPDITYLIENKTKVRGILITHAHEDHIGALPFLLREVNAPVYGTRLTLGFINDKLREHGLDAAAKLVTVKPRDVVELGCFSVEFIRVTHSIVDGCGLGITTPVGRVVHTGDFKIDPTPVDNEIMISAPLPSTATRGRWC